MTLSHNRQTSDVSLSFAYVYFLLKCDRLCEISIYMYITRCLMQDYLISIMAYEKDKLTQTPSDVDKISPHLFLKYYFNKVF